MRPCSQRSPHRRAPATCRSCAWSPPARRKHRPTKRRLRARSGRSTDRMKGLRRCVGGSDGPRIRAESWGVRDGLHLADKHWGSLGFSTLPDNGCRLILEDREPGKRRHLDQEVPVRESAKLVSQPSRSDGWVFRGLLTFWMPLGRVDDWLTHLPNSLCSVERYERTKTTLLVDLGHDRCIAACRGNCDLRALPSGDG